ncbi:Tfp pilus assembly protein PilV [Paraburkholderia sp. GAS41]|jgi:Tfp pilus assembly protein PilV|uniref:type IV pilus modification PilV family protein n=1 Tax=Paraburkholderia sp. GAS41 TaxID=3035134 RepID=UPI003D202582
MSKLRAGHTGGASLIEVMLAVALTAVTALGLLPSQLWIAREARSAALREHAVFVADAVAEAARAPGGGDSALRQWATRATNLLPEGEASTSEIGGGVSFARVTWAAAATLQTPGEVIDKPESCGDVAVAAGRVCVALAFVK